MLDTVGLTLPPQQQPCIAPIHVSPRRSVSPTPYFFSTVDGGSAPIQVKSNVLEQPGSCVPPTRVVASCAVKYPTLESRLNETKDRSEARHAETARPLHPYSVPWTMVPPALHTSDCPQKASPSRPYQEAQPQGGELERQLLVDYVMREHGYSVVPPAAQDISSIVCPTNIFDSATKQSPTKMVREDPQRLELCQPVVSSAPQERVLTNEATQPPFPVPGKDISGVRTSDLLAPAKENKKSNISGISASADEAGGPIPNSMAPQPSAPPKNAGLDHEEMIRTELPQAVKWNIPEATYDAAVERRKALPVRAELMASLTTELLQLTDKPLDFDQRMALFHHAEDAYRHIVGPKRASNSLSLQIPVNSARNEDGGVGHARRHAAYERVPTAEGRGRSHFCPSEASLRSPQRRRSKHCLAPSPSHASLHAELHGSCR